MDAIELQTKLEKSGFSDVALRSGVAAGPTRSVAVFFGTRARSRGAPQGLHEPSIGGKRRSDGAAASGGKQAERRRPGINMLRRPRALRQALDVVDALAVQKVEGVVVVLALVLVGASYKSAPTSRRPSGHRRPVGPR